MVPTMEDSYEGKECRLIPWFIIPFTVVNVLVRTVSGIGQEVLKRTQLQLEGCNQAPSEIHTCIGTT